MTHSIYLYIAIMAGVSFLIRTLPLKLVVPPTLTVRESTGPVRRL